MEGLETVNQARAGSREAFIRLIRANETFLYAVAKGMLRSPSDALDAIQETILNAYQGIEKLREPAYFRTWLTRILINECRRIIRHNHKIVPAKEIFEQPTASAGLESDVELLDLLNGLDMEHKEVVVLFYMEDLSVKDIAHILDLTESGVKSRLHRARLKLAMLLKEPELKEGLQ